MLDKKCILAYGLDEKELAGLKTSRLSVLEITDSMSKMKIIDILSGEKTESDSEVNFGNEKIIIFNNVPDKQLNMIIGITKKVIRKKPVLATVTPTSLDWAFEYLVEHLLEEREWHKTNKGSAMHEQE